MEEFIPYSLDHVIPDLPTSEIINAAGEILHPDQQMVLAANMLFSVFTLVAMTLKAREAHKLPSMSLVEFVGPIAEKIVDVVEDYAAQGGIFVDEEEEATIKPVMQ